MTSTVAPHRSALSRFFRNPTTGRVVVLQAPNAPLWVWIVATLLRLVLHPGGLMGQLLSGAAGVGLATWAVLEVARGDSPFRRVLGAGVLVGLVLRLIG